MSIEGEGNGAKLEKIQGGVDLINERLKHATEMQNERHQTLCEHITRIDTSHVSLDGRVVVLERRDSILLGERQGIGLAAKVLPFLGGGGVVAIAAFIGRQIGI